jgi:hypothetical protein
VIELTFVRDADALQRVEWPDCKYPAWIEVGMIDRPEHECPL